MDELLLDCGCKADGDKISWSNIWEFAPDKRVYLCDGHHALHREILYKCGGRWIGMCHYRKAKE